MSRVVLWLILWLFLPTLISEADDQKILNPKSHSGILKKQPDSVEIPYVFSKLTLKSGPVEQARIDHPPKVARETPFSLIPAAEATEILTNDYLEKLCNSVNTATRLDELKAVLSQHNFELLKAKEKEGASQYTILAVIQSMRPHDIHVTDSDVQENRATVAVSGWSQYGPTQGVVHLVKDDDVWKIESEEWKADKDHMPIYTFFSPTKNAAPRNDLLAHISPDCAYKYNVLGLTQVPFHRESKAISFVYLMNKRKIDPNQHKILPGEDVAVIKDRGRMHILFTGSKKYPKEQMVVENYDYPMDVSVAKYNDGFAPSEWNMILPRKKPREIDVSLLWSF
jgi:hypothetical protein